MSFFGLIYIHQIVLPPSGNVQGFLCILNNVILKCGVTSGDLVNNHHPHISVVISASELSAPDYKFDLLVHKTSS